MAPIFAAILVISSVSFQYFSITSAGHGKHITSPQDDGYRGFWVQTQSAQPVASPGPCASMLSNTCFSSGSVFNAASFSLCSGVACAAEVCKEAICCAMPGFCRRTGIAA